jgi:hypothetical protein
MDELKQTATERWFPQPMTGGPLNGIREYLSMPSVSISAADPGLIFWLLALVHVVGLASMLLTRLPQSHRIHALCHHGFIACLIFVAAATMFTILTRSNWWVWSGTTFSLMAVGATAELGRAAHITGF